MTRTTRGPTAAANEAHVLSFDLDNDNNYCALTVLVKGFRFYITVDRAELLTGASSGPEELEVSDANGKVGDKFQNLVRVLRVGQEHEEYRGNGRYKEKAEIFSNSPNPPKVKVGVTRDT